VLIHRSARLDDYDQQGKLNFNENPIYRADKFSSQEIAEINQALNISQTSTSTQYYQKNQQVSKKVDNSTTPNSNSGSLGTVAIIGSILALVGLGIYGVSSIVKKYRKIKK